MNYTDLYDGLEQNCQEGWINKQVQGDLSLYNYSHACQFGKYWNEFTLRARGLVLNTREEKVQAWVMPKFFNYEELEGNIPVTPFHVYEKYDGSMGVVFHHNGIWKVSTRGSFSSDQAIWAELFLSKLDQSWMNTEYTYIVEIIFHENRIVVDYDWEGLVVLTAFDSSGQEVPFHELESIKFPSGVRPARRYDFSSLDELLRTRDLLDSNSEGFVVKHECGYRWKLKGEEYCQLHKMISNVTPKWIYETLSSGQNIDAYLKALPDEFYDDAIKIVNSLQETFLEIRDDVYRYYEEISNLNSVKKDSNPRKEFALKIKEVCPQYLAPLFAIWDGKDPDGIIWKHVRYI